jgi:Leucine-rich repeat (LRR) protein
MPPGLANLINLEILNLANNQIEELPTSLSSMPKLRILNLRFASEQHFPCPIFTKINPNFSLNRLNSLPRGFGAFPALEVLDLTYNNLNETGLPGNFFMIETLRALYLADNDFEFLPPEVGLLKNLQIVRQTLINSAWLDWHLFWFQLVLRENDLIDIPKEIGELQRLRELHLQGNRLTMLPPELGKLKTFFCMIQSEPEIY